MLINVTLGKRTYVITADSYNFILADACIMDKNNKPRFKNSEYFSNIFDLLNYLFNKELRNSEAKNLRELAFHSRHLKEELVRQFDLNYVEQITEYKASVKKQTEHT